MSIFAINLTTALGLGLAIDYSLFVVSRYREELRHGLRRRTTPSSAPSSAAGRTVAFSAVTVAVSLSALLVFPLVLPALVRLRGHRRGGRRRAGAVVVLPALLAVLGTRVDARSLLPRGRRSRTSSGFWHRMRHAGHEAARRRSATAVIALLAGPRPAVPQRRVRPARRPRAAAGRDEPRRWPTRSAPSSPTTRTSLRCASLPSEDDRAAAVDAVRRRALAARRRRPRRRRDRQLRRRAAVAAARPKPRTVRRRDAAPGCRSCRRSSRSRPRAKRSSTTSGPSTPRSPASSADRRRELVDTKAAIFAGCRSPALIIARRHVRAAVPDVRQRARAGSRRSCSTC